MQSEEDESPEVSEKGETESESGSEAESDSDSDAMAISLNTFKATTPLKVMGVGREKPPTSQKQPVQKGVVKTKEPSAKQAKK